MGAAAGMVAAKGGGAEGAGEACTVPGAQGPPVELPPELFELGPAGLSAVLSLEAWEGALSEGERAALRRLLPGEGLWDPQREEQTGGLLGGLLRGDGIRFGSSPSARLWDDLRAGRCNPDVVQYRAANRDLEWRQYVYSVRAYHDGMVARLRRLRELVGAAEGKEKEGTLCAEDLPTVLEAWHSEMRRMAPHVEQQEPPSGKPEAPMGGDSLLQNPASVLGGNNICQRALVEDLDREKRESVCRFSKSVQTIPESSPEQRERYREEERRRYGNPGTVFRYTARDGSQSSVPALMQPGSKMPKMRPHPLLLKDRSPVVTILSLVRDACARFPEGVGTRVDICVLIMDSQFFVEDAKPEAIKQCVISAMDRLRYQKDSCVTYNWDTKMYSYRHKERNQEDFMKAAANTSLLVQLEKGHERMVEMRSAVASAPRAGSTKRESQSKQGGRGVAKKRKTSPGGSKAPPKEDPTQCTPLDVHMALSSALDTYFQLFEAAKHKYTDYEMGAAGELLMQSKAAVATVSDEWDLVKDSFVAADAEAGGASDEDTESDGSEES